jgi:hypothetical protein
MNRAIKSFVSLAAACLAAGSSAGATIDFETVSPGIYTELTVAGITFTRGGQSFGAVDWGFPSDAFSGISLGPWYPYRTLPQADVAFRAEIGGGFSSFSIGMGDNGTDEDQGRLEAYDAQGNLLDSDSLSIASGVAGGGFMSVSSTTPIAYVLFYELGSFPGVVAWDNVSFASAVPEPQTAVLLGAGLAAAGWFARRRRS